MTRLYLRSLELTGFKSFVETTRLLFKPGINALVGPNGCGKSNIADAIRWVLGEQSPRSLRGKKMEDLIFAGSQKRKGLGMTQVALTLAHVEGTNHGSAPSENGGEEIVFTRRLFRTGESEYLINKTPCRLKDITDLLLDLRIGANALSLLSQEHIIDLITSKPEQKRNFIEEAAGVIKYKLRKKEALEKLEHAQQNLVRIKDIFLEVQKQRNYLGRQAKKAQEYKKIRQEIRGRELTLLFHELGEDQKELDIKGKEYQELKGEELRLETQKSSYEAQQESLSLAIVEEEKEQQKARDVLLNLDLEINRTENRIELLQRKLQDLRVAEEKLSQEQDGLSQKANALEKELDLANNQEKECNTNLDEERFFLEEKERQFNVLNNKYCHSRDSLEEEKAELVELLSQTSQLKNQLVSLDTRIEGLTRREARLNKERTQWQGKLEEMGQQLEQAYRIQDQLQISLETLKARKGSLKEDLDLTQVHLEDKRKEIETLKGDLSSKLARLESLETLQNSQEGSEEGPRSLINSNHYGLRCLIVDILQTSPEYEKAIEAALEKKLLAIIAQDHNSILEAISHLKNNSGGRNFFIPLQPRVLPAEQELYALKDLSSEQLIGPALEKVEYGAEYYSVVKYLLGDVVLVKDLEGALSLWQQGITDKTLVTLEGEVLDPHGGIVGGDSLAQDQGLLGRRRKIQELNKAKQSLAEDIEKGCRDEEELKKQLLSIQEELEAVDGESRDSQKTFFNAQGRLKALEETREKDREYLEALGYEAQEVEKERQELQREQASLQRQIESLHRLKQGKEEKIQEVKEESSLYESELEEIQEEVISSRVRVSAAQEKKEAAKNYLQRIKQDYDDITARTRQQKAAEIQIQGEKNETKKSLQQTEENLQALLITRDNAQKRISDIEEVLREKREELKDIEKAEKVCKDHLAQLTPTIQQISLACSQLQWQINQVKNKLQKDYNLTEEEIGREMQRPLSGIDKAKEQNKIAELTEQITKLGEINITAIEEYEKVQERYKFLQEQQEDLHKSIASLHQAINKINRSIEKDFFNTFNALNNQFGQTFKRLFQGGEARLSLTQEDDLMESGVDLIVQPPGKKLQNIALLSAGEKALSALALLFSVFMLKPTPFCLMDEVDAPLDDANLERFSQLLQELSTQTQFIIITHNKRTMAWANALYGVTMEEEGVSKIISVSLKDPQEATVQL